MKNNQVCKICEMREDLHKHLFGEGFKSGKCRGCRDWETKKARIESAWKPESMTSDKFWGRSEK